MSIFYTKAPGRPIADNFVILLSTIENFRYL
jgi:hypothetical protein